MNNKKTYAALDSFRVISAILIIAIHTSPLLSINVTADFILTRIIARAAVPFFFLVTGYFMYPHLEEQDTKYVLGFCKKIGIIYLIAILLYLPLNFYTGYFKNITITQMGKDLIFDGTFYHLWYLPAVILGVLLTSSFILKAGVKNALALSFILYVIGLGGDSYYGLVSQTDGLKNFYDFLFGISSYTRNGIFFAPMFLTLGAWIRSSRKQTGRRQITLGLIFSTIFLFAEGMLLYSFKLQRHDSMYISLIPCMYFLFQMLLLENGKSNKNLRSISLIIYIIHPWVIILVRGFAKIAGLWNILIDNSLIHFVFVSIGSCFFAWMILFIQNRVKKNEPSKTDRAWAEINVDALKENKREVQKKLPPGCELMAIVKANAYGHGSVLISKTLEEAGVNTFGVATLKEGIVLRKNGIRGEILILGLTHPDDLKYLTKYHLTQTVLNYEYASTLNQSGKKIKVHIKIDTGMHRLGEDYSHLERLEQIFAMKNIIVEGMFTHLSVADSLKEEDIAYTKLQVKRFFQVVSSLKEKGYHTGKLHYQSSYGILNYKDSRCDLARVGIVLYGVLSEYSPTKTIMDLRPVLSVRARVGMVRELDENESVSYGRTFTSQRSMKIAAIAIGYADGIPRNLSGKGGYVLIHGKKAPVIGRICMDQLMADVTSIDTVRSGDIATIIGRDGEEQIYCEDLAKWCGTITNEILSRLGERLERVTVHNR